MRGLIYYQTTSEPTGKTSCETSLVKLVNDILRAMEKQLVTAAVILDLSVVFDTVYQDLLLDVLEHQYHDMEMVY